MTIVGLASILNARRVENGLAILAELAQFRDRYEAKIRALPASIPGVYRIYDEWTGLLYVGQGADIRERLLAHHRDPSHSTNVYWPSRFDYTRYENELVRLAVEQSEISYLNPVCNIRR